MRVTSRRKSFLPPFSDCGSSTWSQIATFFPASISRAM